jgi:hypothetical protein
MTKTFSDGFLARHFALSIAISLVMMLISATIAFATLYNVNTNDGNVNEWQSQGIPGFQTDPAGDTINGGGSTEDIIETRVASGNDNTLYFLLKTAAAPAVNAPGYIAVASIDCNHNGIDQEFDDRLIVYMPHLGSPVGPERVMVYTGDQSMFFALGPEAGQQVGEYIEWGVPIDQLPPDDNSPAVDCRNQVGIRFGTADSNPDPNVEFDSTALQGWGVPNTIHLQEIKAQPSAGLIGAALLAMTGFGILIVTLVMRRRHQFKTRHTS